MHVEFKMKHHLFLLPNRYIPCQVRGKRINNRRGDYDMEVPAELDCMEA